MTKSAILDLVHRQDHDVRASRLGPSTISTECDACVARNIWAAVNNVPKGEPGPYWMGALWGTAVHDLLYKLGKDDPNVLSEHKLVVGEIEGYGPVSGYIDRFEIDTGTIRDYKGMTRKDKKPLDTTFENSLAQYAGEPGTHQKMRHKLTNYVNQLHMYGPALTTAGYEVNEVVIEVFFRDGSGDTDITVLGFDYNAEYAVALWNRAAEIAANLEDTYESHPHCFPCGNG